MIKNWRYHFIQGLKYGYPLCCILDYCFGGTQGLKNGVMYRKDDINDSWVPCRFHKRLALSHYEYMKLLNNGNIDWYIPMTVVDEE